MQRTAILNVVGLTSRLIGVGRTIAHRLRAVNEKIASFYSA